MSNIDVVLLVLDRLEDTLEAIHSVLNQEGVRVNVWLVDQGSSLDTLSVLRKAAEGDKRIVLKELGQNLGVAAGRNLGMRMGKAELIVSIDNDAVLLSPKALIDTYKSFENASKLAAIGYRIERFPTNELDLASWVYPKELLPTQYESFLATRFCGAGHAIRREAFALTRGYDERLFFYWEELDLSFQMIQNGYSISYEPSIVVRHKVAPARRTNWKDKRFYYLLRNALYIDWKYYGSATKLAALATGYLMKGLYNGVTVQAFSGLRDGIRMVRQLKPSERIRLNAQAKAYIEQNDLRYRGGFWRRVRQEVFAQLPKS